MLRARKVNLAHRLGAAAAGCLPLRARLEFCFSWRRLAAVLRDELFAMPTYEYSCEKCGKNFDAYQSMKDARFAECPQEKCQQEEWGHGRVKRLLGTGAGLIFKGSGFYITDYRSNSYKEGAKKDAPASSASGDKAAAPAKESGGSSGGSAAKPAESKPKSPAAE